MADKTGQSDLLRYGAPAELVLAGESVGPAALVQDGFLRGDLVTAVDEDGGGESSRDGEI